MVFGDGHVTATRPPFACSAPCTGDEYTCGNTAAYPFIAGRCNGARQLNTTHPVTRVAVACPDAACATFCSAEVTDTTGGTFHCYNRTNMMAATAVLANDKAVAFGCFGNHPMGSMFMAGATHTACAKDGHGTEVFLSLEVVGYTNVTFDDVAKAAFKKGIATLAQVNAGDVHINKITDHVHARRRQLLAGHSGTAVEIQFSVKAFNAASVTSVTTLAAAATPAAMKTALETAGLTTIISVEVLMVPAHGTEVFATLEVVGYTVATFNAAAQTAFKTGVATVANAAVADVQIVLMTDHVHAHRRQLLASHSGSAVEVIFSVKVMDYAAVTTLITGFNLVTPAVMKTGLEAAGLATIVEVEVKAKPTHGMHVFLSLEIVGYNIATFNTAEKTAFKKGLATIASVGAPDVRITTIADHVHASRRQLLVSHSGLAVEIDSSFMLFKAAAVTSFLNLTTTPEEMEATFKTAGLTSVLAVEVLKSASTTARVKKAMEVKPIKDTDANGMVFGKLEIVGYTTTTFNDMAKTAFKKGIANIAKVNHADVTIIKVTDHAHTHRRQLLASHSGDAVEVEYSIKYKDAATQTRIQKDLDGATAMQLTTAFKTAGLDSIVEIELKGKTTNSIMTPDSGVSSGGARSAKSLISSLFVFFGVVASLA